MTNLPGELRDMGRQTGICRLGPKALFLSPLSTWPCVKLLDITNLPTVLEWFLLSGSIVYISWHSQYHQYDKAVLNCVHVSQHPLSTHLLWVISYWAVDIQMVYLQQYHQISNVYCMFRWLVSKHLQPLSTGHELILAIKKSWIQCT